MIALVAASTDCQGVCHPFRSGKLKLRLMWVTWIPLGNSERSGESEHLTIYFRELVDLGATKLLWQASGFLRPCSGAGE